MRPNLGEILRWVVGGIITCLLLFALFATSGCAAKKPVIAPSSHVEKNDSTEKHYIHDTTFIDRWHTKWISGDTVYLHDSIYYYDGKSVSDTVYVKNTVRDTIPQIVEKELSGRQVFLIRSGVALWIVLALFVVAVIVGIVIKFAK